MKNKELFRVGFIQNNPVFGEIEYNLSIAESLLIQNTADLTILPELFSTGYNFLNKEEAFNLSEVIPEGPTTQSLIRICKKNQTAVIAGIVERDGNHLYTPQL